MPATFHPSFKHLDPSANVWRYTSFAKFVSMIESSSLWFTRADRFDDPFEGSTTQQNIDIESAEFASNGYLMEPLVSRSERLKIVRKSSFVNCWHASEYESAAMWTCYTKTSESVAILSDFGRLLNCIDVEYSAVGKVEYIDYV